MKVDLIVRNAMIVTVDDVVPRAHTLAVHHGRVLALNPDELSADIEIDAQGAALVPGFGDAHNHMAWFGSSLDEVDLTGLTDLATLYDRVAERAATLAPDAFVKGAGYDDTAIGGHPHRRELDRAAGGRPVVLKHRSGHVTTVNSPVLERIGVFDGSAVVPTGGVVVRDESGDPTGTLEEQAQNLARALLVPYATDDTARAIGSDVFAEMQRAHPRPDARPRIEHAAVTTPEQIAQMAEVGVTPVPQARFLYEIGDTMAAAIGPDRAAGLYRHASFLRAGLRVPGSSDRPVAAGAPLLGMQSMVERRSSSGAVLGPDERVDATTALRAYTLDAAWIAGEEHERGSLTPGKLADFVLLTDDVTAVLQDRIGETGVIATFVGGRCTHGAGELGLEQEG